MSCTDISLACIWLFPLGGERKEKGPKWAGQGRKKEGRRRKQSKLSLHFQKMVYCIFKRAHTRSHIRVYTCMLPTYGSFAICIILNLSYLLVVVLDEMLVFKLDRCTRIHGQEATTRVSLMFM